MIKNIEDSIEHLLTYMSLSTVMPRPEGNSEKFDRKFNTVPMHYFDGAEPFIYLDSFYKKEELETKKIFSDVTPKDLDSSLDIKMIMSGNDNNLIIQRRRKISKQEYLKYKSVIRSFNPYIVEVTQGYINILKGSCEINKFFTGYSPKKNNDNKIKPAWIPLIHFGNIPPLEEEIEYESNINQLMMGLQFARFYDWKVYLGYENNPGITFQTDPTGAREIFRLRDIPEGKKRRTAMRNWVKEHYRKKRIDPTESSKVVEHLRGTTEFVWNGLKCKIIPSQYDLNKAKQIKFNNT